MNPGDENDEGKQLDLFDELGLHEGIDVEYKSARGGLPGDLWETYSAFANTAGGTIWLGVAQKDGRLVIHGLDAPEKLVGDFWNTVNNHGKVSRNLLGAGDVDIVAIPGGERRLVRIRVPRADRRQRPIYIGPDPFRGTFRRNFEGDYRCTEIEVRRMFADQAEEPADSRILEGFSLEDIHAESIRQFRTVFGARIQHVWQTEDDRGLLEKLGGWRRDRSSAREGLTLAGLLMFGREQAIRDPAAVAGFHLDYRERFSDDPAIRWTDRLTLDGTWEGNLFQFYQRVMLKLSSGPGVKRPFQTNAEGYRVAGTPVVDALQEALVNALIHADYGGQGGVVIDRWLDRFEFSNPGTLLVSREQLLRGGVSECRNKSLQLMFQMLGAGDKAGSGIDKIRAGWASQHWRSPSLRETHRPDRVMLSLPMVSTLPEPILKGLQERFGPRFAALSGDEVQAVVAAAAEGDVTNQRLQEMLTLHRVDITRMLRGLVRDGLLTSEGVGRGTRYRVSGEEAPPIGEAAPPIGEAAPPIGEAAPPIGEALRARATRVRDAKKVPEDVLRAVLLDLCTDRFLTIQQLAELMGRNAAKLRDRHVRPLVAEGLLVARFPGVPSHPDQAYRSANDRPKEAGET
jgi:ATP-dependent DNA helicase RecG